nr:ribonuclease E-like [Nerophis lumbriciformis]
MLINAQRPEQLRLAIVEGKSLEDYQVDIKEAGLTRGNIYRGVVANIQPSLNAAFIDLGEERHGFLSADDVLPHAYHQQPPEGTRRPRIDQILEKRRPIQVQVTKDGINHKGPALTTNLAVAGRYLVLMPHDEVRAISRKAESSDDRDKVRERLDKLKLPEHHGVIVRTNGLEQNQTTLNRDLSALLRLWNRIVEAGRQSKGPKLLYSDQDLLMQALRDYLDSSMTEVVVDSDEAYDKASSYMRAFMPRSKTRLLRYRERVPLFSRYQLEQHIDRIYERQVPLPSGGSIVIDGTEALTAIDVNSGRATKNADHEESIFNVNMEAAEEVGRQLRLRDIGGLVVIDFIDMRLRKHQRKLEKTMRDAMKVDKARHSVSRISANGLVEINRQRIKQALRQRTHRACPTCSGVGSVPSAEFSSQAVLRKVETRAASGLVQAVTVALHPEIADALQNRYRRELAQLEADFEMHVEVLATPTFSRSEERIDWTAREHKAGPVAATLSADDLLTSVKSRRRGGRGRKKAADATANDETRQDALQDDSGQEKPSKPTRKRSRRRGGRKPAGADTTGESQKTEAADSKDTSDKSKPGRSPRGRRGGAQAKAAEGSPSQAASGAADDSEAPAKPKRRRGKRGGRGRRKKPDESSSTEQAAANDSRQSANGAANAKPQADPSWPPATGEPQPAASSTFMFREPDGVPASADKPAATKPAAKAPAANKTAAKKSTADKPARKRRPPRKRPTLAEPSGSPAAEPASSRPPKGQPTLAELSGKKPAAAPKRAPRRKSKPAAKAAPSPAKATPPPAAPQPAPALEASGDSGGSAEGEKKSGRSSWQWWRGGGSSGDTPSSSD